MFHTLLCKLHFPFLFTLIVSLLACNLPIFSNETVFTESEATNLTEFPELAAFGELASIQGKVRTLEVGSNKSNVKLSNNVKLLIPAGAFLESHKLQITRVDVAFEKIAPDVKSGFFYVIESDEEVITLGKPITLELTGFNGELVGVRFQSGEWVTVPSEDMDSLQIKIDHFSRNTLGVIEFLDDMLLRHERVNQEQTFRNNNRQFVTERERKRIENSDKNVRAFYGVGEKSELSQEEICIEILNILQEFNQPQNREFPAGYSDLYNSSVTMGWHLYEGNPPSKGNTLYWQATKDSMAEINSRILQSEKPLSPGEVLRIAIEANNGNIPLGVLAAHNALKEITYCGRDVYGLKTRFIKPGKDDPCDYSNPNYGELASHLQSWRTQNNITAAGEYDKMGPLYHIFAAMTGGLWLPTDISGEAIAAAEQILRITRRGGDRPDFDKGMADQCGVDAASWLRNNQSTSLVVIPSEINIPDRSNENVGIEISDFHGEYCNEAEGTYEYKWSVNIFRELNSKRYIGTIKYHNCPGGGRVLYHVVGEPQEGVKIILLTGTKKDGAGELYAKSPDVTTFYLDVESGQLTNAPGN